MTSSAEGAELREMGLWFCCCLAVLWTVISADPSSRTPYTLSQTTASFDQARAACSPGILTTVTTQQEVQQIRDLINTPTQEELTVWVGLMKFKNECVISHRPLRGFRWVDDVSQESEVIGWLEQPPLTCTEVLCAVLRRRLVGSKVELGLVAVSCKDQHQFICKGTGRQPHSRQTTMKPTEPEPTTRPATLKPDPLTLRPRIPTLRPDVPTPGSETKPGASNSDSDSESKPGSGSGKAPDSCQHPNIPDNRSVKLDSSNSSWIQVECWSNIKLELFCLGQSGTWQMLDGSPANFSSICQPCDLGFQKDSSGHCVDIDECSSRPCRSKEDCLNTPGSYSCVCMNQTHNATCDDPETTQENRYLTGILVPVLVAVAVLLVLLVIIAVAVKCCSMRREKKRAREEEELKTKEAT